MRGRVGNKRLCAGLIQRRTIAASAHSWGVHAECVVMMMMGSEGSQTTPHPAGCHNGCTCSNVCFKEKKVNIDVYVTSPPSQLFPAGLQGTIFPSSFWDLPGPFIEALVVNGTDLATGVIPVMTHDFDLGRLLLHNRHNLHCYVAEGAGVICLGRCRWRC